MAFCGLLLLLPARRAGGIEISLEENKAGQGKLGYVDMRRVFNAFPETMHAKESFDEIVEATEEKINVKRAEILRMRNSIDELRIERDFIVKKMPLRAGGRRAPAPLARTAPAVSTETAKAPAPLVGGRGPSGSSLPGLGVSSAAVRAAGVPVVSGSSAAVQAPPSAVPVAVSSASGHWPPPPAPVAVSSPSAGVVRGPAPVGATPEDPALAKIDQELQAKTLDLARMEADFKETESKAEENLLKLEKRKTEIILGNIYKILREVARENGVTVVVDSKQILYGYKGVDLTDKLIQRLRKKK